jgi:hypothetical protein
MTYLRWEVDIVARHYELIQKLFYPTIEVAAVLLREKSFLAEPTWERQSLWSFPRTATFLRNEISKFTKNLIRRKRFTKAPSI